MFYRLLGIAYIAVGSWLLFRKGHRHVTPWHMHKCPCGNRWVHQTPRNPSHHEAVRMHTCNACNTEVWDASPLPDELPN